MKQHRLPVVFVVIILLLVGSGGLWLRQAKRQYALNCQLIEALKKDDTKQALALVNEGADPNTHFNPPPTPSFQFLLRQFLHHQSLPADDSPTAFLLACRVNCLPLDGGCDDPTNYPDNLALVQAMYLHGANLDAQTTDKHSAVYGAVAGNQPRVIEWLLDHGANVNAPDKQGYTPLFLAAVSDHPNTVRMLLAHGANVNLQDDLGNTILHFAAFFSRSVAEKSATF